jgi:hypothetical protein
MRRNSPYASFREAISHAGHAGLEAASSQKQCIVRVKLFNAVMREHSPGLLAKGIMLEPSRIVEAFGNPLPATMSSEPAAPGYWLLRANNSSGGLVS